MKKESDRVLMIGITSPEEGGSERHIFELSKIINSTVLTQKGSICKNKIEIPVLRKSLFLRNISFAFFVLIYSIKLLFEKRRFDLIHIHENLLYCLAPILRIRYKVVTTVHGIRGFRFYDSKLRWFFFKFFLKFSNTLIAVNIEDKKELDRWFSKVVYVPNGVDLSLYDKINVKTKEKITFIGRIHEQKGLIYLLDAFEIIKKDFPKLKLEIIGDVNEYGKELKSKFNDPRIIWRGYLSDRREIVSSLKSAYCIVLPSLWEGLPLTLFESLASGRPVVTSDIPAFKTVVKDEVIYFKVKDYKDLASKLRALIKNKKESATLGNRGKNLSKKYTWENIAKETLQAYKK